MRVWCLVRYVILHFRFLSVLGFVLFIGPYTVSISRFCRFVPLDL